MELGVILTPTLDRLKGDERGVKGFKRPFLEPCPSKTGANGSKTALPQAFHKAGTMDEDNEVVSLKIERKVTAGNNAGKRLA